MAKGGKTLNDRILAANVRTESLNTIMRYLKLEDENEYKRALILKLAGTVLPRIQEISGADGGLLQVFIDKSLSHELTSAPAIDSGK